MKERLLGLAVPRKNLLLFMKRLHWSSINLVGLSIFTSIVGLSLKAMKSTNF